MSDNTAPNNSTPTSPTPPAVDHESESMLNALGVSKQRPYLFLKWEESTVDQRVLKLRDEVRELRNAITYLHETVEKLRNHSHGQHGELLVPMHSLYGNAQGQRMDNLA